MTRHLRIVHDGLGWAYWHRARALERGAPSGWRVSLADEYDGALGLDGGPFDLVLALNYLHVERYRRRLDRLDGGTVLVTSYNTGWPRRRPALERCLEVADSTVFVNRASWEAAGRPPGSIQISNGVDLEVFCPAVPPADRSPRVLWCGSTYHRALKGYDDLLLPLAERLAARGLPCDFRLVDPAAAAPMATPAEMAAWYNTGTVYLCASSVEGTPNPVLEAAACGLAIVSTPVGNVPELVDDRVNGLLVERTAEALERGAVEAASRSAELGAAILETIAGWDWSLRGRDYFRLFDRLLETRPTRSRAADDR